MNRHNPYQPPVAAVEKSSATAAIRICNVILVVGVIAFIASPIWHQTAFYLFNQNKSTQQFYRLYWETAKSVAPLTSCAGAFAMLVALLIRLRLQLRS